MNNNILNELIEEVNLENSLITVNFVSKGVRIENICVDTGIIENDLVIFSGERNSIIDKVFLEIENASSLDVIFDEESMCYSLIQKENRVDFYIHT